MVGFPNPKSADTWGENRTDLSEAKTNGNSNDNFMLYNYDRYIGFIQIIMSIILVLIMVVSIIFVIRI